MKIFKTFLDKTFKTAVLMIAISGTFFIQSCSSDSNEVESSKNSFETIAARPLPVSPWETTFSTTSELMGADHGCYTVQINVFATSAGGTKWLLHTAIVTTGNCGKGRMAESNEECLGWYYDYNIISDVTEYDSCLKNLLLESPELHELFVGAVSSQIQQ